MKFSVIALGLILTAGTVLAQQADKPGKKTSPSGQAAAAQAANPSATEKSGNPAELKTQTMKGTLVDAACGGSGASASSKKGNVGAKGEADRNSNAGSSCNISSTSGEFALQTKDGRTLRFDAVGNERVKQELLNRKSWTNASAAGKPIQATVSGTQTGDSLLVVSIH